MIQLLHPVFPGSWGFLSQCLSFIIVFCLCAYFPYQNLSSLIPGTVLYYFNIRGAQDIKLVFGKYFVMDLILKNFIDSFVI